jgi:hypothetical protein
MKHAWRNVGGYQLVRFGFDIRLQLTPRIDLLAFSGLSAQGCPV